MFNSRGRARRVELSLSDLYALTITSDLAASLRAQLPSAYRSALEGDPAPLLRTLASPGLRAGVAQSEKVDRLNFVTGTATLCAESPFPWSPASAPDRGRDRLLNQRVAQLGSRAFRPFGPSVAVGVGTVTPSCLRWPSVTPPAPVSAAGPSVPTLVLSGLEDFRTPIENARSVAAGYPNARLLPIPYAGHSVVGSDPSGCAAFAAFTFLGGGTPRRDLPAPSSSDSRSSPRAPVAARAEAARPEGGAGAHDQSHHAHHRRRSRSGDRRLRARASRRSPRGTPLVPPPHELDQADRLPLPARREGERHAQGDRGAEAERKAARLRRGHGARGAARVGERQHPREVQARGAGARAAASVRVNPFRLIRVPRAVAIATSAGPRRRRATAPPTPRPAGRRRPPAGG